VAITLCCTPLATQHYKNEESARNFPAMNAVATEM